MIDCNINDVHYDLPSNWDELTRENLLDIVSFFYMGMDDYTFKIKVILSILNANLPLNKDLKLNPDNLYLIEPKKGSPFFVSPGQMLSLVNTIDWLTTFEKDENNTDIRVLNSMLTINPLPIFKHKGVDYYGPEDKLFNLIFDEYLDAEIHFRNYLLNNDTGYLDKLIATLYRPKSTNSIVDDEDYAGDMRHKYNSHVVGKYAEKVSDFPPKIKLIVFLFYQGCRRFIALNFRNVFSNAESSQRSSSALHTLNLIDALSGEDVTKTEAVKNTLLYTILTRLEKSKVAHNNSKKPN